MFKCWILYSYINHSYFLVTYIGQKKKKPGGSLFCAFFYRGLRVLQIGPNATIMPYIRRKPFLPGSRKSRSIRFFTFKRHSHTIGSLGYRDRLSVTTCSYTIHSLRAWYPKSTRTSIGTSTSILWLSFVDPIQSCSSMWIPTNVVRNTNDDDRTIPPAYYMIGEIIAILNSITDTMFSISHKDSELRLL